MKKKVKFGEDHDETSIDVPAPISRKARTPLSSFTDGGFESQTYGLFKQVTKQQDLEPCAGSSNLTIRLKVPSGTKVGDGDAEEDESVLPCRGMRASILAKYDKKQEFAPMAALEGTCQVEGCTANLAHVNDYFRRNKVCQNHFKAFKVKVHDSELRFCQQCNRFHMLAEFDEDKRSCRVTLAGHNNRRKRSQPEPTSVLPTGTLVCLPGKGRQGGSLVSEDLERTITNKEMSESENNLRDDASSELVYTKKNSCSQMTYVEKIKKARSQELGQAYLRKEEAGMSNASTSTSKLGRSKNNGSRKRTVSQLGHANMCQVEGCMFDLLNTKDYFKRRKVCEEHFKALKVKVENVDQRFCQQCSRFHVLAEFDEGRKSCKRMLMGHNMRRRKGQAKAACREMSEGARKEECNSRMARKSLGGIQKVSVI